MVGVLQERAGHAAQQFPLHLQGRFAGGDAGAVTDPEDVGVHRYRGLSKGGIEHHVGGLAADAGQPLQRLAVRGDLALMVFEQDSTGLDDISGLAVEQPDGSDVVLETLLPQGEDGLRGVGQWEELGGDPVHHLVGSLSGEDNRHQELEWRGIPELSGRCRVGGL